MAEVRAKDAQDPTGPVLVGPVFDNARSLGRHRREYRRSGLPEHIRRLAQDYDRIVSGSTQRGDAYGFGALRAADSANLHAIVRRLRPEVAVETGVCNGVSTAAMLLALEMNRSGRLYSIDLPEHTQTTYPEGTFWEGKAGAAVPHDRSPGWVIPDHLRPRWELVLGRSQDVLGPLLDEVAPIDLFLHDSEHSYECMMFEYEAAYAALRPGGLLISDDTHWNSAFDDFAQPRHRTVHRFGRGIALIVK